MTKTALLNKLAEATGISKRQVGELLENLTAIAYQETKKNGAFTIPGIGKMVKQKRKARIGRNPKTGESIKIAAKTVVKIRMAKAAKDAILGAAPAKPAKASAKKRR
jgi:DNA-binding protein HU-beta